jgi:hypothetical protein
MSQLSEAELKDLHKKCSHNKEALSSGEEAGCFYCQRTCRLSDIKKWVDLTSDTAICPHCSIDSVLPGVTDLGILSQMYLRWFKPRLPK